MLNPLYGSSMLRFYKIVVSSGETGSELMVDKDAEETFSRNPVPVTGYRLLVNRMCFSSPRRFETMIR